IKANILKEYPKNALIKYKAPIMDKQPLDNIFRAVYSSKPDDEDEETLQAWFYIESLFKNMGIL
ncbi:31799_t:CDS:2, partial [Racocetra persica]